WDSADASRAALRVRKTTRCLERSVHVAPFLPRCARRTSRGSTRARLQIPEAHRATLPQARGFRLSRATWPWVIEQPLQVRRVAGLPEPRNAALEFRRGQPAVVEGNLLGASDLQPLPVLNGLHELACLQHC